MAAKRIRSLTTRWLAAYKLCLFVLLSMLVFYLVYDVVQDWIDHGQWFDVVLLFSVGYFVYHIQRALRLTFTIEFDETYLYVIDRKQDTLIPLENIRSVELMTLGGVFKVTFFEKEKWGTELFFKPSLLYPLNFRRKDALVDLLRSYISHAKRKREPHRKNALHS